MFAQDLPGQPFNSSQLMPKGSLVIAMDNNRQGNGNLFNLKTYGLLVTLLNNQVKLKWIIKPGKLKNAPDFSVSVERVLPSFSTTGTVAFAGGPFVIFAADTAGVIQLARTFNATLSAGEAVRIFRTTVDIPVDVRHDMAGFIPRGALLQNGQNQAIHLAYYLACGIPAANYRNNVNAADLANGCYTFASDPHNDGSGQNISQVANDIRNFVENGGNFLAQCYAVTTYENNSSSGHFMSPNNIIPDSHNQDADSYDNQSVPADIPFLQFEGNYCMSLEGYLQEWSLSSNAPINNNAAAVLRSTTKANNFGAMLAKHTAAGKRGGLVFYIGNHLFDDARIDDNTLPVAVRQSITNGIRLFMNAFLTPTDPLNKVQATVDQVNCRLNGQGATTLQLNTAATWMPKLYPLSFKVYADISAPWGTINTGDPLVASGSIATSNQGAGIPVSITGSLQHGYSFLTEVKSGLSCVNAFTSAVTDCRNLLPVQLTSFDAIRTGYNKQAVAITWETASEINCRDFDIQRNNGTDQWHTVGTVNSQSPGGTSQQVLYYQATDHNTNSQATFYRLRQNDRDGGFYYSKVVTVPGLSAANSFTVFPNPNLTGSVTLQNNNGLVQATVTVTDLLGRLLFTTALAGRKTILLSSLPPGMSLVEVSDRDGRQLFQQKIITQAK